MQNPFQLLMFYLHCDFSPAGQREDASDGVIQEERKRKLDDLGFIWQLKKKCNPDKRNTTRIDEKWEGHFAKLLKFKEEHGHPNVPDEWSGDKSLSKWVKGQRVIYNRNLMPKDRLKKLQDIGFVFGFQAQKKQKNWNRMYDLLKVCEKEDGNFQVALVGDDAPSLARWIQRQREAYRTNKMEPGREILLRKLDFHLPDKLEPEQEDVVVAAAHQQGVTLGGQAATALGTTANANGAAVPVVGGGDSALRLGTDVGKMVAESISVLANFMSISPNEVATRLTAVPSVAAVQAGRNKDPSGTNERQTQAKGLNVFGRLMPLIVKLRTSGGESDLFDCGDFITRMLREAKADYQEEVRNADCDAYNRLLALAVDLGNALDDSEKSEAAVQSCETYFEHIIMEKGQLKRSAEAMAGMLSPRHQPRMKI